MDAESARRKAALEYYRRHTGQDYVLKGSPHDPQSIADFAWIGLERNYGESWSRPGLDLRTKSFITLSAVAAQGCDEALKAYIAAAHAVGITKDEIVEWLIHLNGYIGAPRANAALAAARSVWQSMDERGEGAGNK